MDDKIYGFLLAVGIGIFVFWMLIGEDLWDSFRSHRIEMKKLEIEKVREERKLFEAQRDNRPNLHK